MIESRQNQRLKDMRRLRRSKGDHAILEGPHLLAAALDLRLRLDSVLVTPEFLAGADGQRLAARLPRPPLEVDPRLLEEIADADSPRGVVALANLPRHGTALPLDAAGIYLFADRIQDPGNLGALARVAEAAGARGLALSPGSAHPNHPRALRASAGSLLRLPTQIEATPETLDALLHPASLCWAATTAHGGGDLYHTAFPRPLVVAVGSEGGGLSPEVEARADLHVTIPMAPPVDSLNVTVAAALVLFQAARQEPATSPD